jgi:sortase A
MIALVYWRCNINSSQKRAEGYVSTLTSLMPAPQNAVPEERRDNTMPAVSIDGKDFIGIIEIPRFSSSLPVGGDWGNSSKYPCLFSGSIYDRTIKIGATTGSGQYSFYRELSLGDTLIFTDMEGNRFTYGIKSMRYEKHADQSTLTHTDADLVLFIKNVYAFDFLIIFCETANFTDVKK